MPVLSTREAELVSAAALDWLRLDVVDLDGEVAVGSRAPLHKAVALEGEIMKISKSKTAMTLNLILLNI